MTSTIPSTSPIKTALERRNARHAEAKQKLAEEIQAANQEFADAIRREQSSTPMAELARQADMARGRLYALTQAYPAQPQETTTS